MKTKILFVVLTGCLLAMTAWHVHMVNPVQADEVPEKYRATVAKGLEYLVKNQFNDGHWEGHLPGEGGQHPVAVTGLAGIALLMERGIDRNDGQREKVRAGKYTANIRKAVDWLMDQSKAGRDGLIFSEHASERGRYMQGHGLATLFLAGAFEDEIDRARREKLGAILTRAVKYIVNAQSTQGGWYHTSRVEGHDLDLISATALQIQALQAAQYVGIPVPFEAIDDAQAYLNMALGKHAKGAKSGSNRSRQADTAAALACRFNSGSKGRRAILDAETNEWLTYCHTEIPRGRAIQFGRDELTHYYYARAVFSNVIGLASWRTYRTAMFDHLQSSQNQDGSWPAPSSGSNEGISVGPVYAAAVWCTILQLDNRSHPLTRERLTEIAQRDRRGLEPWLG